MNQESKNIDELKTYQAGFTSLNAELSDDLGEWEDFIEFSSTDIEELLQTVNVKFRGRLRKFWRKGRLLEGIP